MKVAGKIVSQAGDVLAEVTAVFVGQEGICYVPISSGIGPGGYYRFEAADGRKCNFLAATVQVTGGQAEAILTLSLNGMFA